MARQIARADLQQRRLASTRLRDRIPGYRTSAAFFSSLRANLYLSDDEDTIPSTPSSTGSINLASMSEITPLPPPAMDADNAVSPGADSGEANDPLAGIPELNNYIATTSDDKVEALRLVADSVAQQRQTASRVLIFHPTFIAVVIALLAGAAQLVYKGPSDLPVVGTTWIGLVMAALVLVRGLASGYLPLAEKINWRWLMDDEQVREDEIMVSRFGDEVIGACVFRLVPDDDVAGRGKGKKRRGTDMALVRAWTVKLKYRGKGIGESLLEDVVRVCVEARGCERVEFDDDHANSGRVLPSLFNGVFDRSELRARGKLQTVLNAQETTPRKR